MKRYILIGVFLAAGGGHGVATAESPFFEESGVNVHFTLLGEQSGDWFGWVAEDLGDINGDGASDFITSAPFQVNDSGETIGKVYVYSGADGKLLASHVGGPDPELMGYGASLAGDLNGDGKLDFLLTGNGVIHVITGN